MTTCEFGLCPRPAEIEVTFVGPDLEPLVVCGLHVTPVVTWGVPGPVDHELRVLPQRAA